MNEIAELLMGESEKMYQAAILLITEKNVITDVISSQKWDTILSVITIIASFIAICISIGIANKQNRIALFEKRYEVYSRFSELIKLAEIVSEEQFSSDMKKILFNSSFWGINSKSSKIGIKMAKLEQKLSEIDPKDKTYQTLSDEIKEKAKSKFSIDVETLANDELLLAKSKLLFGDSVSDGMKEFFEIYSAVVMSANFVSTEELNLLFDKWNEVCAEVRKEKLLEKMEKFLKLT